ncbi:glycosyltransferase [Nocardia puris]|uniref:Glycosyl transferase family 28 n=1 Tax=Nocardia puris TaxID=208602 RepID=A0A366DPZ7_9NOCA|nr:glycosyltransferase [Nocardia puris]MBF6365502.1 glycosyltransferase [Nocardia puris]MBF6459968.1 glycosyltransferase [Nocardia puris]RBO91549.1 glycosyl transferase family 28 [Nocardia puris]
MRVVLSTYGSRGDVEPMAALAVRLRERGVRVAVCAPPDFADLLTRVEVPPVFVSFGSIPMLAATDTARVAVEAIRGLGRRVILSRGWAGLESIDDRDDCFVVGEVNQQALFERVAAVVHHGGAGTTTAAARAGAPQVLVPQVVDQPYWAGRVVDLGIGAEHEGSEPTVESLSAAVEIALASEARARAVAGSMRAGGAAVAADLLVDAIRRNDLVNA